MNLQSFLLIIAGKVIQVLRFETDKVKCYVAVLLEEFRNQMRFLRQDLILLRHYIRSIFISLFSLQDGLALISMALIVVK